MIKPKAAFAAAVSALLLLFATPAAANEWKMEPLSRQVTLFPAAQELTPTDQREFLCLALAVYHEARGTPERGQQAVAFVVVNRTESRRFPQTICGVVWQPSQFTWTNRPVGGIVPRERQAWLEAQQVSYSVMYGGDVREDPTSGATHFYNVRLASPPWARRAIHRWQFGSHMFVRLSGI